MNYREKWTKRYGNISSDYVIHHLNFRHADDRISNLILLPKKFHLRFHYYARYFREEHKKLKEVL